MSQPDVHLLRGPRRAVAAAMILAITPGLATAGGFFVQEQSVKGMGRAYSGEAADTGADSLWWNPAAIARTRGEAYAGAHGRFYATEQANEGSTITRPIAPGGFTTPVSGRQTVSDHVPEHAIPNGAVAFPIGDRFALGASATKAYHLENELGADAWTRYDTVRNLIDVKHLQATGAMRAAEWLDLGVGVNAQYTEAYLHSAYPNLSPVAPDALSRLDAGDGWNYGWTVGAQAHLDRVSLGASYRSAMKHELEGRLSLSGLQAPLDAANFSAPAATTFGTPWIVALAARWQATPQLTLNAQAQRFGWSEYDAVRVTFGGATAVIEQAYEDVTTFAVGADYELNPLWTLRAGWQHDPTPTPSRIREPGVPDGDRAIYAAGASFKLRPNLTVDGGFNYVDFKRAGLVDDNVFYAGSPAQTEARLRGAYSGHAKIASVGLRWRF